MEVLHLASTIGWLLILIGGFILTLWIIIAIHELGHHLAARWCGIHSEVFSIGMGPSLWERRDRNGTLWRFGAYPIGGFVKFRGDADIASSAARGGEADAAADSFPGASLKARAITVTAGPLANFILAILVLAILALMQGVSSQSNVIGEASELPSEPLPQQSSALTPSDIERYDQLREGDHVLSIDGHPINDGDGLSAAIDELAPAVMAEYQVMRDGEEIDFVGPHPDLPVVTRVLPTMPAREAGLQEGDLLIRIDDTDLKTMKDIREILAETRDASVMLTFWRDGDVRNLSITPALQDHADEDSFETRWSLGVSGGTHFHVKRETPGLFEAIGIGMSQTWDVTTTTLSAIKHMITGAISTCNIAGPIGVAELSTSMTSDGIESFLYFLAVLSIAVGIFNLLPIPVLDGGHLLFHLWEGVKGTPPTERVAAIMTQAGLFLVIGFMIFALLHDLFCG